MPSTDQPIQVRSDVQRNHRELLDATGRLLRDAPESVTLVAVAQAAGLSKATVYRHFSSVQELHDAYLLHVILELRDYSDQCTTTGPGLFDYVVKEWGRLLTHHGAAMIQIRSRRGCLERLRDQDPVITAVHDTWQRPIQELLTQHHKPASAFPRALTLCNILFDPREILDINNSGQSMHQTLTFLSGAYHAALQQL
jgi:AcrR family transcriptional regulator